MPVSSVLEVGDKVSFCSEFIFFINVGSCCMCGLFRSVF